MAEQIRARKSLGQHFLRDDEVHDEILHWARLSPADRVLEIGAGDGTLTRSLGRLAGEVVAVETDRRCLRLLNREFPPEGTVRIVEADILRYDLSSLLALAPLKVIADLPYNIATAVLDRLLERRSLFSLMVLMFQKEVALRLTASPGTGSNGSLTLATRYRAEAEIIRIVPPQSFVPPPKVESALLQVIPRKSPLLPPAAEEIFARLTRAAFRHRRKTFLNSLAHSAFHLPPANLATAMASLSIDPRVRAEEISFEDYLRLAGLLADSDDAGPGTSPPAEKP
jgi:16S rRNA (adenine1518-N6/adenine1519-N6)-dimethyltransferase